MSSRTEKSVIAVLIDELEQIPMAFASRTKVETVIEAMEFFLYKPVVYQSAGRFTDMGDVMEVVRVHKRRHRRKRTKEKKTPIEG